VSADRSTRIATITATALSIPASERQAYLSSACAGDARLHAEVLNRLESDVETVANPQAPQGDSSLNAGELLDDRFRILRFIGRGGMGEVYEAEDLELHGTVALKVLRPEFSNNPRSLARFQREVQLARKATHPNLCRVFDVGYHGREQERRVFLTMEFLAGESLWHRIRRAGKVDPEMCLQLVRQMAAGLAALHEQGILHRDLKPCNVMIVPTPTGSERAVICDFGLARSLETGEAEPAITRVDAVVGTPRYMSPEQRAGRALTPASDIFALGVVVCQMLAGNDDPPRLSPEVPSPWNEVIGRCLAPDPADRPQTAADVVSALEAPTPAVAPGRRGRKLAVAGAAAVTLLIAGLVVQSQRGSTAGGERHVAVLPLNVPGDDAALRVFSAGLTESITSGMARLESANTPLVVVPAREVRAQNVTTPADARTKFRVDTAVAGSLEAQGDRLKVLLQVIDTRTMKVLQTVPLDDERSNSWQLQDTAVARLARAMDLRLQPKYAKSRPGGYPADPAAYELYLQARGYLQREDKADNVNNAIDLLKRAVALDPKFAAAHSALAQAYFDRYRLDRDPKAMAAALESARYALSLNPDLPETNIASGTIYYGTGLFDEARQRFEKAIELDPANAEAYQGLANSYLGLKDYTRAEATYRKAIQISPNDWTVYKSFGFFYYFREEFDKAAAQFQKVVELTPDSAQGYLNLGAAYGAAQNWTLAERAWLRVLELDPKNPGALSNLGKVYLDERDQPARGAEMYRRSLAVNSHNYRGWGQLGRAYTKLGQREPARDAFNKALQEIDAELMIDATRPATFSAQGLYRAYLGRADFVVPVERALSLAPESAEALERAATAYAVAGDKARATEYLNQALLRGYPRESMARNEYLKDLMPGLQAKKQVSH
jgi:serine/threonine protein kinase/lipoprotein NlpI